MISAILLVRNEEKTIKRALQSVQFCDEVLVFDNGSSDKTLEVARGFKNVKVSSLQKEPITDFSKARNKAMKKLGREERDWILWLDGDEELDADLQKEIQKVTSEEAADQPKAYFLKRKDWFWGKPVIHGEVGKAYRKGFVRLVQAQVHATWHRAVHEELHVKDGTRVGTLTGYINHYPHQSIADFLADINIYSTLRAAELFEQGVRTNVFQIILWPEAKFSSTYFLRGGFLDGAAGFVYSFMMAFHSFLVRSKLYVLAAKKPYR